MDENKLMEPSRLWNIAIDFAEQFGIKFDVGWIKLIAISIGLKELNLKIICDRKSFTVADPGFPEEGRQP